MSQYRVLSTETLDVGVGLRRPSENLPDHVLLDSPVMDAMAGLSQVTVETVSAYASVNDAGEKVIASGVRLLFVTDQPNQVVDLAIAGGRLHLPPPATDLKDFNASGMKLWLASSSIHQRR